MDFLDQTNGNLQENASHYWSQVESKSDATSEELLQSLQRKQRCEARDGEVWRRCLFGIYLAAVIVLVALCILAADRPATTVPPSIRIYEFGPKYSTNVLEPGKL